MIHFVFHKVVLFFGLENQTVPATPSPGLDPGQETQTEAGWNLERLQGDGGGCVNGSNGEDLLGVHHQGG